LRTGSPLVSSRGVLDAPLVADATDSNNPTPATSLPQTLPPPVAGSRRRGPTATTPTCPPRRSRPTPLPHPCAGFVRAAHPCPDVDRRTESPRVWWRLGYPGSGCCWEAL
jgi:hypothetical protein